MQTNSMSKANIDEIGLPIHHNKCQGSLVLQDKNKKRLVLASAKENKGEKADTLCFCLFSSLSLSLSFWHASIVLDMQTKGLEKCFRFWNHEDIYESWRKTII